MVKELGERLRAEVRRVVVGRDEELTGLLVGILAQGHLLLEGVPGTAKTLLVRSVAALCGIDFKRVQCTPDLMPADILGTNVFDAQTASFRLLRGPVFTDFLLADEINRTTAKTQAALLESMEERRVTLDGESHPLSPLFTVLATMNPIEFEGTYPLPEAQLDRFLLKIAVPDLTVEAELEVLARHARREDPWKLAATGLTPVVRPDEILAAREAVERVAFDPEVQRYLLEIVRRTRTHPASAVGASTRAAVALLKSCRALAALEGRDFVIPDDIQALAPSVLAHRISARPEALMEDLDGRAIVRQILETTPVPRGPR